MDFSVPDLAWNKFDGALNGSAIIQMDWISGIIQGVMWVLLFFSFLLLFPFFLCRSQGKKGGDGRVSYFTIFASDIESHKSRKGDIYFDMLFLGQL